MFRRLDNTLTVIMYHRINDNYPHSYTTVSKDNFKKQMALLKRRSYTTISLDEAYGFIMGKKRLKNNSVLITFDDGFKDNCTFVYPILKQFGFGAAVFLTVNKIGKDRDYLNWDEVRQMSLGGISFGSHTLNHPNLCSLTSDEIEKELKRSKSFIERKIAKRVDFFCYPYGYFNAHTKLLVQKSGYQGAFSVFPGLNTKGTDPYEIRRIEIGNKDSLFDFGLKAAGLLVPLQRYKYRRNILKNINSSSTKGGRLNILYVIWALGLGGAERVVINLVKGLNKSRFNVLVCCLNEQGVFSDELLSAGIEVIALNKKGRFDISIVRKLFTLIKDKNIDIVHTHLWGANLWGRIAAKLAAVAVIIATEHNVDIWKRWYHKVLDRLLSGCCDKIIVVSKKVKQFYQKQVGLEKKKLELIYNGIDVLNNGADAQEKSLSLKREWGIYDGEAVVANIGRIVPAKAQADFIECLRILQDNGVRFKALLVGEGPLRAELESKAKRLNLKGRVVFTGLIKDIQRLLNIVDIITLSSIREGLPLVVLEAMRTGIPVVATNVGGTPELIKHKVNGFLVPAAKPKQLAGAIERLIKDKDLRKRMGQAGKRRAETLFSLDKMIGQTEDLYQRLYESKRSLKNFLQVSQ